MNRIEREFKNIEANLKHLKQRMDPETKVMFLKKSAISILEDIESSIQNIKDFYDY